MEELLQQILATLQRIERHLATPTDTRNDTKTTPKTTPRRARANAEKCKRYRAKKKAATPTPTPGVATPSLSESPLLTSFLPSESLKGKTAARARGKSRANKTEFPVDWEPELKFDEGLEFAKFKASALAHGRVYVNWPQAWANWKLNAPNFNRSGRNGRRHGSVLDAFDRIGERLVAAGASEDYVPGSSGPRPLQLDQELRPANPRLISSR